MRGRVFALGMISGLLALGSLGDSRADLPPPDGQTRVSYSFRVTGSTKDAVLVAFPMYVADGSNALALSLDRDEMCVQGYTPGIYSLPTADAASLAGKDQAKVKEILAAKGTPCVKAVPRVFTVPTPTRVTSIVDVFAIEAGAGSCRTSFAKTVYGGARGEKGEGGVDGSGHRLPPQPFGDDLPAVGDLGFSLEGTSKGSSPAAAGRGGCAGCTASGSDVRGSGALGLGLVFAACALGRGRTRSRRTATARAR